MLSEERPRVRRREQGSLEPEAGRSGAQAREFSPNLGIVEFGAPGRFAELFGSAEHRVRVGSEVAGDARFVQRVRDVSRAVSVMCTTAKLECVGHAGPVLLDGPGLRVAAPQPDSACNGEKHYEQRIKPGNTF